MIPVHSTDPFYDYTKWQSYLPALMACAAVTKGPVLEVGMGHYSTPLLHAYCLAAGRELISLEHDGHWFSRFCCLTGPGHRILLGDYDDTVPTIACSYDHLLTFIDNAHPLGNLSRVHNFSLLLPVSDFVVLHDYCDENFVGISHILAHSTKIKHLVTDAYRPPTLVATDKPDLQIPTSLQALS